MMRLLPKFSFRVADLISGVRLYDPIETVARTPPSMVPREIASRTSGAARRTGTAPSLRAIRSIGPPVVRSFSPARSFSVSSLGLETKTWNGGWTTAAIILVVAIRWGRKRGPTTGAAVPAA